jgi:biotin carboxyl carrier protein
MRRYQVTVGGKTHVIDVQELSAHEFRVTVEGRELDVTLSGAEEVSETIISPEIAPSKPASGQPPSAAAFRPARPETLPPLVPASLPELPPTPDSNGPGVVKAPMPGTITAVEVKAGDSVSAGQVLVKLEAMKMVNAIKSPGAGRVAAVRVQAGESVGYGQVLVTFEGA